MSTRAFILAAAAAAAVAVQPNIILIVTDDQDVEMGSLTYMPKLNKYLSQAGANFTAMYAAVPVCCPSRSALYSGRYQHNNRVVGNSIPANCSSRDWQVTMETDAFATYLTGAGYATSFAGKYLNDYGSPAVGGVQHIPPGWTNWQGLVGNSIYYNYTMSNNGLAEKHADNYATDYLPDVVLNKTLAFINQQVSASTPFFALMSPPSCHGPQEAAPQYQGSFPGAQAPRYPNFNASLPTTHWLQATQAVYGMDANGAAFADLVYRRRLQTLLTVDDMIESLVNTLQSLGVLDNTYILYTTDNGYHTGTFGLIYDKRQPWETDTHLPFFIRGPGITPGTVSEALVTMPDLSATVLDIAGVKIPPQYDGNSVLPFITGGGGGASAPAGRLMSLVEYHGETADGGGNNAECSKTGYGKSNMFCNPDGQYVLPPFFSGHPLCVCQDAANNTYNCLRVRNATVNFRYCEFSDAVNTVEMFNYLTDPYELVNLAPTMPSGLKTELSTRLSQAVACQGTTTCNAVLSEPLQQVPLWLTSSGIRDATA